MHPKTRIGVFGLALAALALAAAQVIVPFGLITFGENHVPSALAGILVATAPLFVALLAVKFDPAERSHGWGLFGVVLASLVNLFMHSSALQFAISVIGVIVFAGLTAWDTQRLKNEYLYGAMDGETAERASIMGALSLYLNFINLFTLLMQLFGQREE